MEMYYGFYISRKNFKMKEIYTNLNNCHICFSRFIAIKITVSVEIFCSCNGKS